MLQLSKCGIGLHRGPHAGLRHRWCPAVAVIDSPCFKRSTPKRSLGCVALSTTTMRPGSLTFTTVMWKREPNSTYFIFVCDCPTATLRSLSAKFNQCWPQSDCSPPMPVLAWMIFHNSITVLRSRSRNIKKGQMGLIYPKCICFLDESNTLKPLVSSSLPQEKEWPCQNPKNLPTHWLSLWPVNAWEACRTVSSVGLFYRQAQLIGN